MKLLVQGVPYGGAQQYHRYGYEIPTDAPVEVELDPETAQKLYDDTFITVHKSLPEMEPEPLPDLSGLNISEVLWIVLPRQGYTDAQVLETIDHLKELSVQDRDVVLEPYKVQAQADAENLQKLSDEIVQLKTQLEGLRNPPIQVTVETPVVVPEIAQQPVLLPSDEAQSKGKK